MRKFTRALLGAAGATIVAIGVTGCATAASGPADGLNVVTTTTQLHDFALNLTKGTDAEVTSLLQPGSSVHSFEPTAADLEVIRTADVVVINGMDLEPWIDDTLASAGFDGTVIDASEGITPMGTDDDDDHAAEEDSDHEEHDDAAGNPHIWTSPANAEIMVQNVADGLETASADNAATITSNAEAYEAKLADLDEWISTSIDQVPADDRLLATNHDALTYYNDAYDITFIGSVMPSWEDNAEPSVAEVNDLVKKIKESGVPAVFTESQLKPTTAEAIAEQAGVKVYSGDDALYTDSLGAADSDGATYISSTIHNTEQILDSWGATAAEVPASLTETN
ncbi:metal ABC transporter substrate-binding protein [Gulosibacter sediminis]|uniref:metal ABC transporter substrate-binding protein n=1 Tax=Gulosibacter sediminis TaxID=1729695 RepID=UPI0024AE08D9|nr:metal ABC transporter substrate-binding protein [Gulosibacter sediminis]